MNGFLVVNHFIKDEKFNVLHNHLVNQAKRFGISLEIKTNVELACEEEIAADFVLFWDKDIKLARRIEQLGVPVFNSSSAIELCDDKAKTYIALYGKLPQPRTFISPLAFDDEDMSEFVNEVVDRIGLPVVYKDCCGSFGKQVFLCCSVEEIMTHITDKQFILQEFIRESSGRDKRLEVVGGKVVACVRRENEHDFRSNVTNGGIMTTCDITENERQLAIKACEILGLDFAGVDILDGDYICEVNSNAHIINIMEATGVDIAPAIFEHIMEKIK